MKSAEQYILEKMPGHYNDLPKDNLLCPATGPNGHIIVIIGNPFTIKDSKGHKRAFELAEKIVGRKGMTWETFDLERIANDYYDQTDMEISNDELIVFGYPTDGHGEHEVYWYILSEWAPMRG